MYASVLIDAIFKTGDHVFDYAIPENLAGSVKKGSRVFVPFGQREVEGFVLDVKDTTEVPVGKIKQISRAPDEFIALKQEALDIAPKMCAVFKLRLIDVLRLFVPGAVRGRKRARKVQNKVLQGLDKAQNEVTLNPEQSAVVERVISELRSGRGDDKGGVQKPYLLHGVTGSGKTEVYMTLIREVVARGMSAIMLVPEIGLTPQVLSSFRSKFGDSVAMIHSGLSQAERYDQWLMLHSGDVKIAIGARSAVFAPLDNIGLVIIDEEHDSSYFSDSSPRFSTHEVARMRCEYNGAAIIMGSATPSVESYHKGHSGEYEILTMKSRANKKPLPSVKIVDMASEIRSGNGGVFSHDMLAGLSTAMDRGEQAMVFLNRRGFSSFVSCGGCGWVAQCESCDVSLVWHKDDRLLKCHYCSARFTALRSCKQCGGRALKYGSIGTQALVEEINSKFPDVPVFRLDADSTQSKENLVAVLSEFAATRPAILVGTQMIAKGHDFPHVSFVGVVEADNSLHQTDYRAVERTFALLTQVAGRAGRGEGEGSVVIQTLKPRHFVYQLIADNNYDAFVERELNVRSVTKYPPYTTIVRVLVSGEVDVDAKNTIHSVLQGIKPRSSDFVYVGAMKSPLGRIKNKYRYQLLCRFARSREGEVMEFLSREVDFVASKVGKKVQIFFEINPQSLS